jgi:transmembrane sensor
MIRSEANMENAFNTFEDSDIFIRFLAHETTPEENRLVELWINESPEHKLFFENTNRIFENNLTTGEQSEFNVNATWNKFSEESQIASPKLQPIENKKKSISATLIFMSKIAAVLVLMVAVGMAYFHFSKKENAVILAHQVSSYTLPDGSVIALNKNSTIQYEKQFGEATRELKLSGEAFFDVKKDPSKPFVISVNSIKIQVVGTSFNVNAYPFDDKTEVVVKTGIVKVTGNGTEIVLVKGEKAEFSKKTKELKKLVNTNPNYSSWKTQTYVFEMTKMSEVFKTLEKDYNVDITLIDPEFNNCTLFARFEKNSLNEILTIIKHTFNVDYEIRGKQIIIKGKGC